MFDEKKFNEIKEEVNILYKTLGKIYCPYFKEEISFNHKGLEHLEFKGNGVRRSVKDQYRRLKQVENLNKYFWSIIPYNRIYKDDET